MSANSILILLIFSCCIILFLQIFSIKLMSFFKFTFKCALSVLGFNLVNSLLASTNIFIGINAVTIIFSTLLGLPGFVTLYIVQAIV